MKFNSLSLKWDRKNYIKNQKVYVYDTPKRIKFHQVQIKDEKSE